MWRASYVYLCLSEEKTQVKLLIILSKLFIYITEQIILNRKVIAGAENEFSNSIFHCLNLFLVILILFDTIF